VGTETMRADHIATGANLRTHARCQGAMSLQSSGAHGNESYPQKLVQLVGYRDPDAGLGAWGRQPLKRAVGDGFK
jgi:hypothetical protein